MIDGAELIYAYTRAVAISDGMLIEVPAELARQAGFTVHTAMTAGAHHAAVDVPPHLRGLQDETGRLWDVLTVLRRAIRGSGDGDRVDFRVLVFDGARHRTVDLYALIGPGDDGEPVMTILLPGED
jgi:hypothetical protein